MVFGGKPEKIVAIVYFLGSILSAIMQGMSKLNYSHLELGVLIVDLVGLGIFIWLAIVSNRFWPIWMSAMQIITVLSHLPVAIRADVIPWAYWRAISLWSYPMLLLLAMATYWHQKRLKELGADPCWKSFSRP
jgi:hypothetical protein